MPSLGATLTYHEDGRWVISNVEPDGFCDQGRIQNGDILRSLWLGHSANDLKDHITGKVVIESANRRLMTELDLRIILIVHRNDQSYNIKGTLNDGIIKTTFPDPVMLQQRPLLGINISSIAPKDGGGAVILHVAPDSLAESIGLKSGYIIRQLQIASQIWTINDNRDLVNALMNTGYNQEFIIKTTKPNMDIVDIKCSFPNPEDNDIQTIQVKEMPVNDPSPPLMQQPGLCHVSSFRSGDPGTIMLDGGSEKGLQQDQVIYIKRDGQLLCSARLVKVASGKSMAYVRAEDWNDSIEEHTVHIGDGADLDL